MIPLTLHLKNFLSYGPDTQTIDFSGYPLICLSGKNGHGKSALLDAITWALWGQARKVADVSKADEGLLRLGQTNMLVILDFAFNSQTYRVRREFTKSASKTSAALDFGILDTANNSIVPLTEKTIRATQAKIESMLNLDAESFINSAFLRQGQSNEFSKKSAKERKEILATILGLTRYESLRKLALDRSKQALAEKQALTTLQQAIEADLAHAGTIGAQLNQFNEQLAALSTQEKALAQEKNQHDIQRTALIQKQQQLQLLLSHTAQYQEEQGTLIRALRETRAAWRATHAKLLTLTNRTPLEEEKKQLIDAIAQHQKTLQHHLELKEQLLGHKAALASIAKECNDEHQGKVQQQKMVVERGMLETEATEKKIIQTQGQLLISETESKKFHHEIAGINQQLKTAQSHEAAAALVEKQFEKRKAYYQKFIALGNMLKNELAGLEQKKLLVHDDDNPSCPLCEQNLSASRKKFIKQSFAKHEFTITHQLKRLSGVIKKLKELLIEQHAMCAEHTRTRDEFTRAAARLQELIIQQDKLQAQHAALTQELGALQNSYTTQQELLSSQKTALATLENASATLLTTHAPYISAHMTCATTEHKINSLAYQADAHRRAVEQLQQVETQLQAFGNLSEHETAQQQRGLEIAQRIKQLKELKKRLAQLHESMQALNTVHQEELDLGSRFAAFQRSLETLYGTKEQVLQEKGKLENQQATLAKREAEHKKNAATIATLTTTIHEYQAIAAATGKDGIQALLIEDAIPEIEQEANQLLSKLTNNQAHIIIESQRDLKKGGAKETLDIKISDPMGIRPYELFSGGEAFRIDFALRVAISKLLARRAGTSLQTLIIDEGFGSQDEEGLNHIMDAMYKIQDDFSKIIIVSHLPAMKDQFPVHFYVEKGPNGSQVSVIEQG